MTPVGAARPLLPTDGSERRATWAELFFDLVFVAAVAALAAQLHEDHSVLGLAVFAGLFVPVWWAWMGYTWFAAAFDDDGPVVRIGLLAGMLTTAALSAGVAGAATGDSTGFVVAYGVLVLVLAALYARAYRREPDLRRVAGRLAVGNLAGGLLWLVSLALPEAWRPLLWAVAMATLMVAFAAGFGSWRAVAHRENAYHPGHIAERYGLFTIVVLGESVVVTAAGLDLGGSVVAAVLAGLGFVLAAAVWWLYFGVFRSMPTAGGSGARFVWAQGHLPVFAGIAAAAVGIEFAIEAAVEGVPLLLADRLPLAAGLAAYLAAMGAIRAANRAADRVVALRVGTAAVVLVLGVTGPVSEPLPFVALLTLLVVVEAALDLLLGR